MQPVAAVKPGCNFSVTFRTPATRSAAVLADKKDLYIDFLRRFFHMRNAKRIAAGTVAAICALSMIGCGKDDGSKDSSGSAIALTKSQKEAVQTLADSGVLPDVELKNKELNWFGHYPINPGEGQVASPDIELFEVKYGAKIKDNTTTWDKRFDDLAALVMAQKAPDFFQADDMDVFPKGAIKAMFQPIDDYVDLSSPLWTDVKETADKFVFNGKHYIATIQITPNQVCVYNRATIQAEGLDDPAELLAKNEWTMDAFWQMCEDFVDTSADKYALDGFWFYDAIQQTTGVPMLDLVDGKIVNNLKSAEIAAIEQKMYDEAQSGICWPRKDHNWSTRGNGERNGAGLGEGKTLFIPIGIWGITATPDVVANDGFGDVEKGEVMFVPMPDNTDNAPYYTSARINGYALCNFAPNPEAFAAFMNCKRACVMDESIQQINKDQMRDSYKWSDEMIEMYDTICDMALANPVFEFHQGVNDELATLFANTITSATMMETDEGYKSWTVVVEENFDRVEFFVNEANTKVADQPTK